MIMNISKRNRPAPLVGLMALTLLIAGCPEEKNAYEIESSSVSQANAQLAKADAVDGKTDKVVSNCASCALSMSGSPDHAIAVSGYTMHFCTTDCKESFGKDITKSVLAMKVPEADEPDQGE
jgi:hypothetical protein